MIAVVVFIVLTLILWSALQQQVGASEAGHHHGHAEEGHAHDDLTKIEGIGPKLAEVLANAGISSYQALAKAKNLEEIIDQAGSRFNTADPTSWPEQAKLAAAGDWDALQKLQDELVGGR